MRPPPPIPYVSPSNDRILLVAWVQYPPIAQVAEPFLKLAGVRVEPRTRRKHDTRGGYGIAPCAQTLVLVEVATGRETAVTPPPNGCLDAFTWTADGRRFAFRNTSQDAVELWAGDAATGAIRRLGSARLNPMLGSSLQWMPDQKTLLVKLVPANAGPRSGGIGRVDRPEHPGDDRRDRREQHVRDARHALEQARRGPLRLLRDEPAGARRRGLGRGHAPR